MVKSTAAQLDFVFRAGLTRQDLVGLPSLRAAKEWTASYSHYWTQQFNQLEKYLEGEER
jgi:hypothetical protein